MMRIKINIIITIIIIIIQRHICTCHALTINDILQISPFGGTITPTKDVNKMMTSCKHCTTNFKHKV